MFSDLPDPGGIWLSLEVFSVNNMSKQFELGRRVQFCYRHPVSGENYIVETWYSKRIHKTLRKFCAKYGLDMAKIRCLQLRKGIEINIYTDSPCSLNLVEFEVLTLVLRREPIFVETGGGQ